MTVKQGQAALVERLRASLADEPSTREVSMFGGRSFMVNDKMIVSAQGNGDLLVRVAPERDGDLIESTGASRAEMGAGRSMGQGWISVGADSITSEEQLSYWVGVTLEYNQRAGPGSS
ncbi:TfoX/Sxy family protein [Arthrobacter castelli]|uniref:TfoX/Sxy family protein n=1 Tax=Arthrobacter castelli TaxID=271431 RepID=UPI0003FCA05D|nr:TfoX/Sxy family protein [Arthrobacter castelli]